jgi:hypothetical protein
MQSHKPGYKEALAACKHFGKTWDELTEQEQKWSEKHATKYDPTPKDGPKAYKSKCCGGCRFENRDCHIRKSVKGEHSCQFKQPLVDPTPVGNRDDLFFLADALKMAADEMRALNGTLRELIAEAEREKRS